MSSTKSSYDRFISIFSPEGKLYQVEYALNAVSNCGVTALAIRGKNAVVLLSQRKARDPLSVSNSMTSIHQINKEVAACAVGRIPDGASVINQIRHDASSHWFDRGVKCTCQAIATQTANHFQITTQSAGKRIAGISLLFAALEPCENGTILPQIFKVDASGYCMAFDAVAIGTHEVEAMRFLEKTLVKNDFREETDFKNLLMLAVSCLEYVTRQKLKHGDIEMGYATEECKDFTVADEHFVESMLNSHQGAH